MSTLDFISGVVFTSGKGPYLYDEDGEEWLDFFADVGTASLGYCADEARDALLDMVEYGIPIHAPNLYHFQRRLDAAQNLCQATGMERVFFCNSGTESVEAAIKIARLRNWHAGRPERKHIWSMRGGFHGRTYGSLAAGDGPLHHYEGFGPLPGDFSHFDGDDFPSIDPSSAAAIILSPVFGNNDVREYAEDWLLALREWTLQNDIALIFDEVQTGSGRTGAITYAQRIGVQPDVLTLAKGVAMGAPVGACLANGTWAQAITPGRHFSTFGGNPFSSVMVNTMLAWLASDGKLAEVEAKGALIRESLTRMGCANVRGPGMLIAFDYPGDAKAMATRARAEHLIIGAFRAGPGPVKITPPLNITIPQIEDGMERLERALR